MIDYTSRDEWDRARDAIRQGDVGQLSGIIATAPDIVFSHNTLGSLLHFAAAKGKLNIVTLLIDHGADPDLAVETAETPINQAAGNGYLDIVKTLVAKGVDLTCPSLDRSPVMCAIQSGHLDILKLLIESGANQNLVYITTAGSLKNALSYAKSLGNAQIVEYLTAIGCRLPVEGKDIPTYDHSPRASFDRSKLKEQIKRELGSLRKIPRKYYDEWNDCDIDIYVVKPTATTPYVTFFTVGLSDVPMSVPLGSEEFQYAELLMHFPHDWKLPIEGGPDWPLEWLAKIANYPSTNKTWLGGPRIIIASNDPPEPLGFNCSMTCLLLLADLATWSPLKLNDDRIVKIYTMVPIYTSERDFELREGIIPLIERLQKSGNTAIVDINRKNVA